MVRDIPRPALILGFAGLIPFLVPAAAIWFVEPILTLYLIDAQIHYAAVVVGFLGAVHWGVALTAKDGASDNASWRHYGWGVAPAVAGTVASQLYFEYALLALSIILTVVHLYDNAAVNRKELPIWYKILRKPLSFIAILSLLVTFLFLTQGSKFI